VIEILRDYKDVFAWTYEDMKGIPPHICEHKIELKPNTKPIKQSRYRMNLNYAAKVKEKIDKLLKAGFIYPIDRAGWLSPIVIVQKKDEKLRVCVDYRKLNETTKSDPFPLSFTEEILETVAGHEILSLLDGFSGYNQVRVAPEDQPKICFITEWGCYATKVMSFGLMIAPSTFQRGVLTIFAEFLNNFMKVFLDDFSIYGKNADHIKHLKLCLQRCRECGLSLNPEKYMICVTSGRLLGHVVCKEELLIDSKKISVEYTNIEYTNIQPHRL
jgi:hypothetical protein